MRCLNNSLIFVGGQIKQFQSRQLNAEFCDLLLQILVGKLKLNPSMADGAAKGAPAVVQNKNVVGEFGLVKAVLQALSKLFSADVNISAIARLSQYVESLVTVGKISQFNISVLVAQLLMRILQCMYKQQDSGATIVQN